MPKVVAYQHSVQVWETLGIVTGYLAMFEKEKKRWLSRNVITETTYRAKRDGEWVEWRGSPSSEFHQAGTVVVIVRMKMERVN